MCIERKMLKDRDFIRKSIVAAAACFRNTYLSENCSQYSRDVKTTDKEYKGLPFDEDYNTSTHTYTLCIYQLTRAFDTSLLSN